MLMGDTYIQDDITINSSDSKVSLAGTYTGFGNTTTKAKNSSSIIVNGANTSLDLSELKELNLGGNTYIGTSKLNVEGVEGISRGNEDVKMGNDKIYNSKQKSRWQNQRLSHYIWLRSEHLRPLLAHWDYSSINNSSILIDDFAIGVPGPKIAAAPS